MIDIAKLLSDGVADEIQIKLEDDELPELPVLTVKVPDPQTRGKIYRKYFKPKMELDSRNMELGFDFVGYAVAMADYVTGWSNTPTPFSQELVKKLLTKFERLARAFSNGLQSIFGELEAQAIKAAEVIEKN